MILKDFKARIEAGGAACRIDAWDSALVFKIGGSYWMRNLYTDQALEYFSWAEVVSDLGDWASRGGWQAYNLSAEVRA